MLKKRKGRAKETTRNKTKVKKTDTRQQCAGKQIRNEDKFITVPSKIIKTKYENK